MSSYVIDPAGLAADRRFKSEPSKLFTELADEHGEWEAGLVWTAACYAYDVAKRQEPGLVATENDWIPLEQALLGQFMYMGADSHGHLIYKHHVTRHSLIIDAQGQAYLYNGQDDTCQPEPLNTALARVYADIGRF